jgi:hypothetical protein
MVAVGVTWSWVVVLAGVAVAVALAITAILGDLPLVFLALLGALAGSSTMLTGVLLLLGFLDSQFLAVAGTGGARARLVVDGAVRHARAGRARRAAALGAGTPGTLRQAWAA